MLAVATVTPAWYLVLGSLLFTIGAVGLLVRRNPLVMFMCVELMLNAVTLTFVTFSRMLEDVHGQTVVVFVLVVAAAEVVVRLGRQHGIRTAALSGGVFQNVRLSAIVPLSTSV